MCSVCSAYSVAYFLFAEYVLLNPLRLFDTVNEPSGCATTLIQ